MHLSSPGEIPLLERQSQLQADRVPPQVRPGHERHRARDNPQFRGGVAGSEEVRPQHAQGLWLWEEGNSSWSHFTHLATTITPISLTSQVYRQGGVKTFTDPVKQAIPRGGW